MPSSSPADTSASARYVDLHIDIDRRHVYIDVYLTSLFLMPFFRCAQVCLHFISKCPVCRCPFDKYLVFQREDDGTTHAREEDEEEEGRGGGGGTGGLEAGEGPAAL